MTQVPKEATEAAAPMKTAATSGKNIGRLRLFVFVTFVMVAALMAALNVIAPPSKEDDPRLLATCLIGAAVYVIGMVLSFKKAETAVLEDFSLVAGAVQSAAKAVFGINPSDYSFFDIFGE